MVLDKLKRIVIALLVVFFTAQAFAATTDLAVRFLDKANEAYEDGNIEDAYKYVNQALAVAKSFGKDTVFLIISCIFPTITKAIVAFSSKSTYTGEKLVLLPD